MSRRKTVKVAQLEGRADAFSTMRGSLCWRIEELFRQHPNATRADVKVAIKLELYNHEVNALRELAVAQRSQGANS